MFEFFRILMHTTFQFFLKKKIMDVLAADFAAVAAVVAANSK